MIKIVAVGDVFLARNASPSAFSHSAELIGGADVAFLNLEAVVSERGQVLPGRAYPLKSPPETLHAIVRAGFNMAALAHNHALDFGVDAMLDTVRQVDAVGLKHAGAGRDLREASTPGVLEVGGKKIALLAYATAFLPGYEAGPDKPGIAAIRVRTLYETEPDMLVEHPGWPPTVRTTPLSADVERLQQDIRMARAHADAVLVSFHWGLPGSATVVDYQQSLARVAIEAGACAILGHHPHQFQGVEIYRGCPIFYSLGNFAFELPAEYAHLPYEHPYLPRESFCARWSIQEDGPSAIEVVPVWIDDQGHPHLAVGEQYTKIQSMLENLCRPFGTVVIPGLECLKVSCQEAD